MWEKNMNILVVSQYYYPENFKINDIAAELVRRGHEVTVLTGLPNYPSGDVPEEYKNGRLRREIIDGVKINRCFEIGRKHGPLYLAINYLSFAISSSLKAHFYKETYDLIFVYQPSPIFSLFPAWILKKKTKKKIVLYCCDIWPEAMKSYLKSEKSILFKTFKCISRFLYSKCDEILVTSKPFIDYLTNQHFISREIISYLPQHAEDTYLNVDFTPENNGCIDFLFAGNVGIAQDMDCIVEACEINRDIENYKVHIVGDGSYLQRCKQLVKEKQLDNFVFHGRHPLEKMPGFYKLADVCLLTLKADNLTGLTMPSKLQGYMAAGKPVVGAINGAAQEVIRESKCGICVNASDSKALANAMRDFIENPIEYKDCGQNASHYFKQNFTKEIFTKELENIFHRMVES
jgi:glycosyltransferase involved in cell wall biosynthesis